ncbi:hypothetical protein TD95_001946 [Thielaviopsis punctulata]|uniref:[histone H3]-trimethyl-L-lysine(9) demethylase n=1 Tax=Thielaviopsis punctulata TaxID=72032 RepID=A0A0F4ZFR3_9PEZI|nr:hypothetical protein TD95_001946 [Thielaviopsis punctulata]
MDPSADAPAASPMLTGPATNLQNSGPRTRRRASLAAAAAAAVTQEKKPAQDDSDLSSCDADAQGDQTFATAETSIQAPETGCEIDPEKQAAEDEDIGEVLPAEWSGKVPIFRPTMQQFKDFKKFMEAVDKYGMTSGIIKIVPPAEWKQSLPPIDHLVKQVRVRNPIKQDIMGSSGTYRQVNFVHGRIYNVPQWRALCDQSEHQPPARRGERRANADRPRSAPSAAPAPRPARTESSTFGRKKRRRRGRQPMRRTAVDDDEEDHQNQHHERPMTPISADDDDGDDDALHTEKTPHTRHSKTLDNHEPIASIEDTPAPPRSGRMRAVKEEKTQSTSARRKYCRREASAKVDEEAFRNFDYHMDISDFTPERCEELERIYWKTLTYAPPLYGADLMGTLFDESTELWNLNKLPNLLDVLGTKVPGVNTAYLYLGMWKATFAWHLEDVDLYSINYLHFGAPKQWYSISQADARRFEAAMKTIWPQEAKSCDQFLRHKGFLISPQHLKNHFNITVNKVLSYPGEFVVTYPYGYHSGYNLGYNCAEAVNFALDTWLPMGKIAKKCECAEAQDSVWVDVYEIERKLRGEEEEYEYVEMEVDDDDDDNTGHGIPSPPDSSNDKTGLKRKRGPQAGSNRWTKKLRTVRVAVKSKARADPVCCLCPNDVRGLEILPTDDGRTAHRMCARYLPETYFDEAADGSEVVCGVDAVMAARHDLKCLFCHSKRGACIQCSQSSCSRVYHASCAAASGAFVEEAEVPVFGADGTEYKDEAFEVTCRFHRVRRDRGVTGYDLENNVRVSRAAAALKPGDICQLQLHTKDVFAGVVLENRCDEEMLVVESMPNRDLVEVQWKWLVVADAADFHLPRASAAAVALPRSKAARDALCAVRGDGAAPRRDEPFVDGYTWAEFVANRDTAEWVQAPAVEFGTGKTMLWMYLGAESTDSRALYTHDWAVQRADAAADFLASVPRRRQKRETKRQQRQQQQQPVFVPQGGLMPRLAPVGGYPAYYPVHQQQVLPQQFSQQQQQQPTYYGLAIPGYSGAIAHSQDQQQLGLPKKGVLPVCAPIPVKQTPVPIPAKYLAASTMHKPSPPPAAAAAAASCGGGAVSVSAAPGTSKTPLRKSTTPIPIPRILGMQQQQQQQPLAEKDGEDVALAEVPPESMVLVNNVILSLRRESQDGAF